MSFTRKSGPFYLAIIGDIVQSRQISQRAQFQEHFHQTMALLNQKFAPAILSPFTVTLGDEFQALLQAADPIFQIRWELQKNLHPQKMVLGLGVGTIETQINRQSSVGMDGPALRLARQCINLAKKRPPAMQIAIQGMQAEVVNCLLQFMENVEARHSQIQRQVIELYRQLGNQKQVAQKLGVSQPSVSQVLKAAKFQLLESSRQAIIQFLNQFLV